MSLLVICLWKVISSQPVIRPFAISYSHPRYLDSYESYANALLSQKFDQISIQLDLHNLQKLPPVTIPVF